MSHNRAHLQARRRRGSVGAGQQVFFFVSVVERGVHGEAAALDKGAAAFFVCVRLLSARARASIAIVDDQRIGSRATITTRCGSFAIPLGMIARSDYDPKRMPLYDYACSRCGRTIEVLAKHGDPPPVDDARCNASDGPEPCHFEGPLPSTQHQRWRGEPGNEGRGGWTRQGEAMVRVSKGRSHEDR